MENYIELAHRSSAPTEPVSQRIQECLVAMPAMLRLFCIIIPALKELDTFKRFLFYGKGNPGAWEVSSAYTPCKNARDVLLNPDTIELLHAAIGMATEAGEMMDALGAAMFYAKPLDATNVCEELGDSLWYQAKALRVLKSTFSAEMERNIAKLRARYPDKFTETAAIERDLDAERAVLEQ